MSLPGQLVRFGCVGVAASAVHLVVVSALVPAGILPLVANVAGFAAAFHVSYYGHRGWTFRRRGGSREYGRMLGVSLAGFAMNEVLYAGLLAFTPLDYRVALAIVLLAVACGTFLAARGWVFTRPVESR
ncbi:GtrA family protein [Luteolibacter flavescens]|uniref:GtrA family protein n=1 Tax=Luteolibacter flavescens TaxID=1859460 RepID=A0ABT3FL96_9BACT|nr:GtrA family protein [Luteolibacter flavescens]MCW1884341.1 GtrA family protein [Luteolibacter flavescens]